MEMSVRVASLEYLGLVAARLRKDTVQSRGKLSTMDLIIRDIKAEEEKDGVYSEVGYIYFLNINLFYLCINLNKIFRV